MENLPRITSVATYTPKNKILISDIEKRILEESTASNLPVSFIRRLTGVESVYHRSEGEDASDLAVSAAKKALGHAGLKPSNIDLVIFASASQDLIEPATAHIVSSKLGSTNAAVMDVKNACNSFLNAIQVADAFIATGQYERVLIASGETPSMATRWNNKTKDQFTRSFAGFSMSDAGAAMVISRDSVKGIHKVRFAANSDKWSVGTLKMGGSMAPRDIEATYFDMDGSKLYEAFLALGPEILNSTLLETNRTWDDMEFIAMHQISHPYLTSICETLGLPEEKVIPTIKDYGNVASVSLPLQLEVAMETGRVGLGDDFAFVGFGGGISTGLGVFTL